jgi:hypothetical protein
MTSKLFQSTWSLEKVREQLPEGLASINGYLRDNQKKLDKLTADVGKLDLWLPVRVSLSS